MDEVEASHLFAEHWDKWLEDTLAEDTSAESDVIDALRYLLNVDVGAGRWRDVAAIFSDNCARMAKESIVEDIDLVRTGSVHSVTVSRTGRTVLESFGQAIWAVAGSDWYCRISAGGW